MNTKTLTILGVLAAVGIAGAYLATRSAPSEQFDSAPAVGGAGSLLFPDLASKADTISTIVVKRAPTEVTIQKDGDTWKVTDKAGYPAKTDAVRALLVGLTQLKLDEPKTARPDQFAKLGVDDPIAPSPEATEKAVPQSAQVTLKDSAGKELASVIVGNPKYAGQGVVGSGSSGVYIRKPGDKQSWLASGQVEVPRDPIGWLESKFADIKRDRIKSVIVTHPGDLGTVTVQRDKQADPFTVRDIPAGRELKDPGVAEGMASTLTGLTFQDVAPAASMAAPEAKPGPIVTLRTFDGLVVTATSITKDAKAWWRILASADEAILSSLPPAETAANLTTPDGTKPEITTPPPAPTTPSVGTAEAIRKEVTDLNTNWSPYAFAPADWKVRSVNTLLADLLKDSAPPAADTAPPALPLPASTPAGK